MSLLNASEHFQAAASRGVMCFSVQIKGLGKGSRCHSINCLGFVIRSWAFSFAHRHSMEQGISRVQLKLSLTVL